MHNPEMFTKDVLIHMLCSIHSCPWLHLYPDVTCCNLAPELLNNVAVSLLTLSSMLPWLLLVIRACYELALAMLSCMNMPSYCWSPLHAMRCSVVSGTSSPTCLLIVVSAMYESVISFAMFAWIIPSFLLILRSSSVMEFCSLSLVLACHAFFCYYMFLYHVVC